MFSNILAVLSFMDLGIGGAIVFCLYKPLAEKDYEKVSALMQLYKKVYSVIGICVCVVGIVLTPFLKHIIKLPESIPNIYLVYWITIANTALSYFLAYRRSLLIADQRTDIDVKNRLLFRVIRFVLLTVSLITVKNYVIYLILDVVNTLASNIHITLIVKKKYDKIEESKHIHITLEDKKTIYKMVTSGIFHKLGQTVVLCTDNIIISAFISTVLVGIYSNYSMVTTSLDTVVYFFFSSLTASVGNFAIQKSGEEAERLFSRVTRGNYFISLYFCVCMAALINPFIQIWAGENYLLSNETVYVLTVNFYISSLQKSVESFIGANGMMYYHVRYRGLIEGVVNLIVSLVFVKYTNLGISGVFLGTTVCFLAGRIWMDAFVLYKYWFNESIRHYVVRYLKQSVVAIVLVLCGKLISNSLFYIFEINILSWIFCGVLMTILVGSSIFLLYRKNDDFIYYKELIFNLTKKITSRKKLNEDIH